MPLELGIVSDELSDDFREAVRIGTSWGIRLYELRNTAGGRIPQIPDVEKKKICHIIDGEGIRVTAVSPGLFKTSLRDTTTIRKHLDDDLRRSFDFARDVGCPLVIVFGFERDTRPTLDQTQQAIEYFQRVTELAELEQMVVAIENEYGYVCDTGSRTAEIVRAVNSPVLRINWDPCNAFGCGEEPFPDGYKAVKPFIANVHAKDTIDGSHVACVPIGEGRIDWERQMEALMRDRVVSHITIETHCQPLVENSRRNVEWVRGRVEML